uniref:Uncharacterized protein n=1 Tax=Chaetoceros debilis TaxID=122233 RepID=A0A7S3V682_9STRA|mmetsp:Transcript_19999/g.29415  ORF Transcript_19999/g.29415 Transcript_19999/m.29415 type:complete len:279 (-) Transcript_19999:371-1207(-)
MSSTVFSSSLASPDGASSVSAGTRSASNFTMDSTDQQPPLFKLVKQSRWRKLRIRMKLKDAHKLCGECDETGLTLLGVALGYHAPLDIIKAISDIDPTQFEAADMFGATPLHIACLNGSPPDCVRYILHNYSNLVRVKDKDERVPLHHAVECLCRDEIDLNEGIENVGWLCRYDPTMIHEQDHNGNTPIDLVHSAMVKKDEDDVRIKPFRRLAYHLREVSIKLYKLRRTMWEENDVADEKLFCSGITLSTENSTTANPHDLVVYGDPQGRFLEEHELK